MKAPRFLVLGLCMASSAALVVGCGSSGSSTEATSSEPAASAESAPTEGGETSGFATAEKEAAKYEEERTGATIPPLEKPAPKGTSVTVLTCPINSCKQTTDGAAAAAKELGWDLTYKTYELTPESYQSLVSEAANNPPEAFVYISAFPNETVEASLTKMHEAGTAIVQIAPQAGETPTKLVPSVLQGSPFYELGGKTAAYKILADAGEATNITIVHDPSFGFAEATIQAFEKTVEEECSACGVSQLSVSANLPATQQLSAVTNYLAANTDVSYLFYPLSDQAAGLPEALAAAGLSEKVKYVTQTASLSDLKQVKEGTQLATIQNENFSCGYRGIDSALRIMEEGSPGIERYPDGYTRILSQENVVPGKLPTTPGTPEDYLKAWGVEG
jgi:ribose transport system substrate-binding protein